MRTRLLVSLAAASFIAGACSVQDFVSPEEGNPQGVELEFVAQFNGVDTKTEMQSDETTILWTRNDAVSIFYGSSSTGSLFTAIDDEDHFKAAHFRGTLEAFTGLNESGSYNQFWAVYPYDKAVSCDGESVVVSLPAVQTAKGGSFADGINISIARSPGLALSFYNTCSWFMFSLEHEDIKSVVFKGNNGEDVAGTFVETFGDNGRPTAPTIIDGEKQVVLNAPEGEYFKSGQYYFITLLPQVFNSGFSLTFISDDTILELNYPDAAEFVRSEYWKTTEWDHYATKFTVLHYTGTGGSVYPNNTSTLDATLDSFEYDESTGKGTLIFRGELTTIGEDSFAGCGTLKTITIPETVKTIGPRAFARCRNLESITIPEGVITIGSRAFFNTGLTSITIPASVDDIGETVFGNCSKLASIVVNPGNEYYDSRNGCNALIEKSKNKLIVGCKNSIIPDTVTSIGDYAFQLLDGLTSITIPASVTALGERVFYHCTGLTVVTFKSRNPPEGGEGLFAECYKLQESNNNNVHIYVPYTSSVNKFKEKASSWMFNSSILEAIN